MKFEFTWDKSRKQGILKSDNIDEIREHFSTENETARIQKRYNSWIPSRNYIITPAGRFEIGMFASIYQYIKSLNVPYKMERSDEFTQNFLPSYTFHDKKLADLNKSLRPYQEEATKKCLKFGRGNIILPTASGKTLLMASIVETVRKYEVTTKTLIIIPTIQLVSQTYKDFIEYGVDEKDICKWTGNDEIDPKAKIIIAGSTKITRAKKPDLDFIDDINLLLVDEVHKIKKKNKISKVIKQIPTNHRFGFTGTMPEDKLDVWNAIGLIGPVLYEKKSKEMRDKGYIANALIKIIRLEYKDAHKLTTVPSMANPTAAYEEENDFIFNNTFRNNIIGNICNKVDKNILVLVDRIEHGENLQAAVTALTDKKVFFIRGDVEVEEREQIRALMEKYDNIICIAISKIFSTGISINNLHYILFAAGGKAKVKTIQSIGRGLRLHDSKDKMVLFDIADVLKYGSDHLERRITWYDKEDIRYEIKDIRER
jgi:superfamily II DNA or RNA helicase